MAFTRMVADLDNIAKLADEPNDTGGLSAAQLKAEFDKGGNAIKQWLNNVLLAALEAASGAGNIGIATIPGVTGAANIQAALEKLQSELAGISQGAVADGSIGTDKLGAAAVTAEKIAAGAITSALIAAGAITTGKLDSNCVTTGKLAQGAVTDEKLAALAVVTEKLADKAVTTAKIANGAIGTDQLDAVSVTAEKIQQGAVTAGKLASGAVSTVYTATAPVAGWTGSAAPYSNAITVTGLLETDSPIADLTGLNASTAEAAQEAWGYVYKVVATANTLTLYAIEKPAVALTLLLRVVRK